MTARRRRAGLACAAAAAACALYGVHSSITATTARPTALSTTTLHQSVHPAWPPTASSPDFPYDCSPAPANTSALLGPLARPTTPAHFPAWMDAVCPEVVAHFTAFPYLTSTHDTVPVMTSVQAAHIVCTVKIISTIGASVGADIMLYHGSLIGALRHGGPVPWDDDADLAMSFASGPAFLEACKAMRDAFHADVTVHCQRHSVFVKVYVEDRCPQPASECALVSTATPKPWRWPYADIFLYRTTATEWQESTHEGGRSPRDHAFAMATVFPVARYYFGGLDMAGPQPAYADAAYKTWKSCRTSQFSHRDEAWVHGSVANQQLNCCAAARFVPFVVGEGGQGRELVGGRGGRRVSMDALLAAGRG